MPYVGSPAQKAAQKINIRKALAARHKPMTDADYIERWKSKCTIDPKTGCWLWRDLGRHPASNGPMYPESSYRGENVRLNRIMVTLTQRPLAGPHEFACHKCDNHLCINPDHLFIGDHTANQRDMVAKKRHTKQKRTHCAKYGHPLSGDNLWLRKGGRRVCRACGTIKCRLALGWTLEEALSTPIVKPGEKTKRRQYKHRKRAALTVTGEL